MFFYISIIEVFINILEVAEELEEYTENDNKKNKNKKKSCKGIIVNTGYSYCNNAIAL